MATDIIPEHASIYSDFRLAFGDDTEEGRLFRENGLPKAGVQGHRDFCHPEGL